MHFWVLINIFDLTNTDRPASLVVAWHVSQLIYLPNRLTQCTEWHLYNPSNETMPRQRRSQVSISHIKTVES